MKNMIKLIALIGLSASALGAVVTHTVTVNPTANRWLVTNSIPQFDTTLGRLRSVSLTIDGVIGGQAVFTNLGPASVSLFANATTELAVTAAGLTAAGQAITSTNVARVVQGQQVVIPLGGSIGADAVESRRLAGWVGNGAVSVVTGSTSMVEFGTSGSGLSTTTMTLRPVSSAVVVVAYEFVPRCEEDGDKDKDDDKDKDGGGR